MNALEDKLKKQIRKLCSQGDVAGESGDFSSAVASYEAALKLVPEPKTECEAATGILAAIGEAHYFAGDFAKGRVAFRTALQCPKAAGNPFLHLRLGQCQYELGAKGVAGDELSRAYMGGGGEIFRSEDPKYYNLVKGLLEEPPGGWD